MDPWERALPWPAIQARSLEVEADVLVLSLGERSSCHFRWQGKESLPGEILSGRLMVIENPHGVALSPSSCWCSDLQSLWNFCGAVVEVVVVTILSWSITSEPSVCPSLPPSP